MITIDRLRSAQSTKRLRKVIEIIAASQRLKSIDLSECSIGPEGGKALINAIAGNPLGEEVGKLLIETYKAHPTLSLCFTSCCGFSDHSQHLLEMISSYKNASRIGELAVSIDEILPSKSTRRGDHERCSLELYSVLACRAVESHPKLLKHLEEASFTNFQRVVECALEANIDAIRSIPLATCSIETIDAIKAFLRKHYFA